MPRNLRRFFIRFLGRLGRRSDGSLAQAELVPADAPLLEAQSLVSDGLHEQAIVLLRHFLEEHPSNAEGWYRLGNALRSLGQNEEALSSYRLANTYNVSYPAALCNLGVVLTSLDRPAEALACFNLTLRIDATDSIAHYNRALALLALSRRAESVLALDQALALNPRYFEALLVRARVNADAIQWQSALDDYSQILQLRPACAEVLAQAGTCYARLERWHEALHCYDAALASSPADESVLLHRGNVLRATEQWDAALSSYEQAIDLNGTLLEAHFNRGLLLEQLNRVPEALESFERAVALDPEHPAAQHSRSLALLLLGRLRDGFASYEWRWKNRPSIDPATYRGSIPIWTGRTPLDAKRILVFAEQGLGDTLQFCRYVPMLSAQGAEVIFEVQAPLKDLMQNFDGASLVISPAQCTPEVDYKVPLMSLPRALGTSLESVPSITRYLTVDQPIVERWRERLGKQVRPRIGLAWSGNPSQPENKTRSMPLSTLVKHLPRNLEYFCLQQDVSAADQAVLNESPFIVKPGADLVETAALCECMDLVISVCTSIAHLAGALGRPLWVLLASNADWRWLLQRTDSPWYPTATLYRQKTIGDWDGVARHVAEELKKRFS